MRIAKTRGLLAPIVVVVVCLFLNSAGHETVCTVHESTEQLALSLAGEISETTIRKADCVLAMKIRDWNSQDSDAVAVVIDSAGSYRLPELRDRIISFLHVQSGIHDQRILKEKAVLALGQIGGEGVFEELSALSSDSSSSVVSSVAVALGLLDDERVVPVLEELASRPCLEVRRFALSGLSRFCEDSSRTHVELGLGSDSPEVRRAAVHWLAMCGSPVDGPRLVSLLVDSDSIIRAKALIGLIRMESGIGCGLLSDLVDDSSASVRARAEEYALLCDAPLKTSPPN